MTLGSALSKPFAALFGTREEPDLVFAPRPARQTPADCTVITLNREERVEKAFAEMPMNEMEARAVRALLDHPGCTGLQLSRICGWMDAAWMSQMLMLCQRRRRFLWPGGIGHDATYGIILGALADYDADALEFRPREALVATLRAACDARDDTQIGEAG